MTRTSRWTHGAVRLVVLLWLAATAGMAHADPTPGYRDPRADDPDFRWVDPQWRIAPGDTGAHARAAVDTAPAPLSGPETERFMEKLGALARSDSLAARHRPGYESLGVAQARLGEILARREFARARGRTAFERWIQSATEALDRLLTRLFRPLGRIPRAGDVLAWLVLIGTVALLVRVLWWVLASGRRRAGTAAAAAAVAPATSSEWARRAHDAAARGALREAVHHAYWAAAHRLAESGTLAFDPTRTHRETLRRVPAMTAAHAPLERLVRRYERVWYGGAAVDDDAWAEVRLGLEELGCRNGSSTANASS